MMKKVCTVVLIILFAIIAIGCEASCHIEGEGGDAGEYEEKQQIPVSEEQAIKSLFDMLYDKSNNIINVKLENDGYHYGYEYNFLFPNGDISNPWGIEFINDSFDHQYYIFRLYEAVHHDGEFSHTTTGDFFAVKKNNGEIIAERNGKPPNEWNENFPKVNLH